MKSKHTQHLLWVLALSLLALVSPRGVQAGNGEVGYIVKLRSEDHTILKQVASTYRNLFPGTTDSRLAHTYAFTSPHSLEFVTTRLGSGAVYIEPNTVMVSGELTVTPLPFLNDPWFTYNALDVNRQWYLPKAQFQEAWEVAKANSSVVVAVLDTGIDSSHEDLRDIAFTTGYDFLEDREIAPGTSIDHNGHGTLITGVLAGTANNGIGMTGAAYGVGIMPLVALDKEGIGQSSTIAEAIVWATDHGAHIINMSLSDTGTGHDVTLANAITYAFSKGVLLVAAAGNDSVATGVNLDASPLFPICDDNGENMVLGVAATDFRDVKPDFSNFGKSCIDVTAPGKRIVSTVHVDPYTRQSSPNSYAYASGTSLAVPLVVAEAALIKSHRPYATNKQVRDAIIGTSESVDMVNTTQCAGGPCTGLLGAGRINAYKGLEKDIENERIQDGNLVQTQNGAMYYINGGKRQLVSLFVKGQRFKDSTVYYVDEAELLQLPISTYAEPREGTLFKGPNSPTVYYMGKGIKYPITSQVFELWKFSFLDVYELTTSEVSSWVTGPFLTPPDGVLLKAPSNPTVYWVVNGGLHPISFEFYQRRGLSFLPVVNITEADLQNFPLGEAYILK